MLKRAAHLASGEVSEEAWYLTSLFQQTQPEELLNICHHTLAKFLELNYDYFDSGWPLQSRMEAPAAQSSFCRSRFGRPRSEQRRFQSRSPSPKAPLRREPLAPVNSQVNLAGLPTPTIKKKPQTNRLGWLKGKTLLPSKHEVSTPRCPKTPENRLPRPLSDMPGICNPDASPELSFPWDKGVKRSQPRSQNSDFVLSRYILDFMLDNPGKFPPPLYLV